MTDKNLGHATAYGYAKSKGYTGTEEEFAELMASYAEVATDARGYAEQAEQSASNAQASATNASASATTAGTSASSASASAQTASTKASEASDSATSASESASTAVSAKDDAVAAKEEAETAKADAETAAEEAQESAQTVANKADKDGTYPDMTVGGVMSTDGSTDSTPYLYRASGGGVEVGTVEEDSIVGGTVAWNQLVQNGNFADASGWSATRGTFSVSNNICSYTSTEIGGGSLQNRLEGSLPVIPKGHRVMLIATVKPAHTTTFRCHVRAGANGTMIPLKTASVTSGSWTEILGINSFDNDISGSYSQVWLALEETASNGYAVGDVDQFKNIQIFDLTQMFGSSVADYIYSLEQSSTGAGVAYFRKLFPKDYYEYNTGELMSVEGLQSHDMVGFNQWDEEWEVGSIDANTGINNDRDRSVIRSVNYIPVLPNTQYYFYINISSAITIRTRFYDGNYNYLGTGGTISTNAIFTVPSEARYMRFALQSIYGTTYNHDICINLSSDRNGEYEPYVKHSYPIDSSLTLRGIPKLSDGLYFDGDTYEADGTVTRKYGIVDLGTLTWKRTAVPTYDNIRYFTAGISATTAKFSNATVANAICAKYQTASANDGYAKVINPSVTIDSFGTLAIYDSNSNYTDASTFKSAMSGVMLVYELATPTTESAEPYDSIQKVSKYGTEEYVSTGIVPVGHVTKYPTDIVSKVDGLPSDFSTLIAPTEKGFTATRAYSVNQFIIVNNQLYRVTASIANGATITVGTNVAATTVADILTQLLGV